MRTQHGAVPVQDLFKSYQEAKLRTGMDHDPELQVAAISPRQIQRRTELVKEQGAIKKELRERGGFDIADAILARATIEC
ncbi:hypothetical protein LTR62_007654 [Meristemomyces frigidus]|uniref:Uncharacterized protein n=1 Tax=Meristemomyces frigidus TaxID=1508187 RepID=A0AAN7TBK2_9PEZI|nr:hypothetical protein LTR62_007654 [Meristemomyces frigidus]